MASFVKVNDFVEHMAEKVHNLGADQLVIALSNTAPASEASNPLSNGNGILANVTQISYTNLSSRNVTTSSSAQTGGTYKLTLADLVLTATGNVATFRYVYLFNDTPTSPADALIGHWDRGSSVSLVNGDSFTVDFDASNGVLQVA